MVSRSLYSILENIPWMERARLVKATDTECQVLERKKIIAGAVFLAVIVAEFILMLLMYQSSRMYRTSKFEGNRISFNLGVSESNVFAFHSNQSSQRDAKTAARFCHPC